MQLRRLTIAGFRSFQTEQTLEFPEGPGLFLLNGENHADPEMGGNATGKSTVWDALSWVLYGKTLRGLKASDLCNWNQEKKSYRVEVWFSVGPTTFHVKRTQSPNNLFVSVNDAEPELMEQDRFEHLLGMGHQPFNHSVVFSQFGMNFLDLPSTMQSALFSEVLDIDRWVRMSKAASKMESSIREALRQKDNILSKEEGRYERLQSELAQLEEESARWVKEHTVQKAAIQKKHARLLRDLKRLQRSETGLHKHLESERARFEDAKVDLSMAKDDEKFWTNKLLDVKKKIVLAESKVLGLESHLPDLQKFRSNPDPEMRCHTCGQEINRRKIRGAITRLNDRIAKIMQASLPDRTKRDNFTERLSEASKEVTAVAARMNEASRMVAQLQAEVTAIKRELKLLQTQVDDSAKAMDKVSDSKAINPYAKLMEEATLKVRGSKIRMAMLKRLIQYLTNDSYNAGYWVKAFKELRLMLVSEMLTQFELEANASLDKLGLFDWQFEFDVERETKSKSVKRGFHVGIRNPYTDRTIPWQAWSGGESRRLGLAVSMGLSGLILNRYGWSSSIEVWDEPSNYLSVKGIDNLLETLYTRASEENRQIWVTDHRVFEYGGFNDVLTVVKDKSGSRFQWHG